MSNRLMGLCPRLREMKPARHRDVSYEPFDAGSISSYEAKFRVAGEVAAMVESGQVIGAGSGSTAFLAVRAIASRVRHGELHDVRMIPTSIESELTISGLGLDQADLSQVAPDWLFVVGGGALLLNGELTRQFNGKAVLSDEPVLSIARGLHKLLLMKK